MGVRLCQPMSKSKTNRDVENTVLKSVFTFMRVHHEHSKCQPRPFA